MNLCPVKLMSKLLSLISVRDESDSRYMAVIVCSPESYSKIQFSPSPQHYHNEKQTLILE